MNSTKRIAAFVGIRGLAILAIVLYHLRPSLLSGGFVGVTIFFTLSGYLFRQSFEKAFERGLSGVSKLMGRRIFRLWPAMLVTIAIAALASYLVSPSLLLKIQADAASASLFGINILYMVRQLDYFAAAGLPSPLTHLWYVATLVRCMFMWALLLGLFKLVTKHKGAEFVFCAAMVLASTIYMAYAYTTAGTTIAYYSPLARFAEFGMGSFAFTYLAGLKQKAAQEYKATGRVPMSLTTLKILGALAFVALVFAAIFAEGDTNYMYYGGFFLLAAFSALLCLGIQLPGSFLGRAVSIAPLRALGAISYSLYLIHYPIILYMNPATRTTKPGAVELAVQLVVILLAALVLYVAVERPCAKRTKPSGSWSYAVWVLPLASTVVIVALSLLPLDWKALVDARAKVLRPELTQTAEAPQSEQTTTNQDAATSDASADALTQTEAAAQGPEAEKVPTNLPWQNWTYDEAAHTSTAKILIIGDSVTEGAAEGLVQAFPNAKVDGKVSRQLAAAPEVYAADTADFDPEAVVVALGTNSLIRDPSQVQAAIDMVDGKPLYFVTIRSPYPLQDMNNEILRDYASKHDNVGIIDWTGASEGHSEYLVDDGVHLTDTGIQALVDLYLKAFK